MTIEIEMMREFGTFCADGERAAQFRLERIDPFITGLDLLIFDFRGVYGMNSSFCNALIANLLSHGPEDLLSKIKFKNCRENVRLLLESAIEIGLARIKARNHMQNTA